MVGFSLIGELLFEMNDESVGQAAVGIGMGAGVGFMQWMAARKYLLSGSGFFLYSTLGFSLAFISRDVLSAFLDPTLTVEITILIAVVLGALISGWFQYRFIFAKVSSKTAGWMLYSVSGWLFAALVTMATSLLNFKTADKMPVAITLVFALLFLSVGGPVLGFITGQFVVPLLKENLEKGSTH